MLEMLVAVLVLAVGLVIVTESISAGVLAAARTERRFLAGQLAADRLNRAAAGEFSAMPHEGRTRLAGVEYHWRLWRASRQDGLDCLRCSVVWVIRGWRRTATLSRLLAPERAGEGR